MSYFERLLSRYRKHGLANVVQTISRNGYLPGWLFRFSISHVLLYDHGKAFKLRGRRGDYVYKQLGVEHVGDMQRLTGNTDAATADRLKAFYTDGNTCASVWKDNVLVAFLMLYKDKYTLTRDEYRSLNYTFLMDDAIRFFGYGYIDPAYRLRGLYPYLIDDLVSGHENICFLTEMTDLNSVSLKSSLRAGFTSLYRLTAIRLFAPFLTLWILNGPQGRRFAFNKPVVRLVRNNNGVEIA